MVESRRLEAIPSMRSVRICLKTGMAERKSIGREGVTAFEMLKRKKKWFPATYLHLFGIIRIRVSTLDHLDRILVKLLKVIGSMGNHISHDL